MSKMTICIDFDGVIHSYENGWNGGKIYGDVVPGFFDWATEMKKHFRLVVYSSRSATEAGIMDMQHWLIDQMRRRLEDRESLTIKDFEFADIKPPAWLTIDDRAIRFDGNWGAPELSLRALQSFKPWTQA